MKTNQAAQNFIDYHKANSKKNTLRNYNYIIDEIIFRTDSRLAYGPFD